MAPFWQRRRRPPPSSPPPPPTIDAHAHLDHAFGGGWIDRPAAALLEVMDRSGIHALVDLSGGWGPAVLDQHLDHFKAAAPERFVHLAGVDWRRWPTDGDGFAAAAAANLARALGRGAGGLKVWKTLGLEARDHHGSLVTIDDPRLDPLWDACADHQVPVVIHVADPPAFFQPLGPQNPRSEELRRTPAWHWHERAPVTFEQLTDQFERLLDRRADVRFVGAHLLDLLDAPDRLRGLLDAHANLSVDLGARAHELDARTDDLARCLVAHAGRVLYGLDHPPSEELYRSSLDDVCRFLDRGMPADASPQDRTAVRNLVLGANAAATFGI